jgi:hypothetical protein
MNWYDTIENIKWMIVATLSFGLEMMVKRTFGKCTC